MQDQIQRALAASAALVSTPAAIAAAPEIRETGEGALPSRFDVTGLAAASIAAAGAEIARYAAPSRSDRAPGSRERGGPARVAVDRRLASMWFGFSIRPQGWALPSPWDPIAGDYRTRDGWIRLHTNAPHHRHAALAVLGVAEDRAAVAAAVAEARGEALESAIVGNGGCAAQMRSLEAWRVHPQGRAVAEEPLIAWHGSPADAPALVPANPSAGRVGDGSSASSARPLAGIRVLDLTRVLAGPVGSRLLAAYGADVLRIDPPDWDEPGVVPEVTLGKRCAGLDLAVAADRARFEELLAGAHVLIHGYRPGALAGLGYDEPVLRALNPGLVDVALCAYGWTGPWSGRRGFDSLVQMSSGIAEAGQRWAGADRPTPLPVQALDHATGYLMAAAAVRGLALRRAGGGGVSARLSLARTAALLVEAGAGAPAPAFAAEAVEDLEASVEATDCGPAQRLRFPLEVEGARSGFERPASALRSAPAQWAARLERPAR